MFPAQQMERDVEPGRMQQEIEAEGDVALRHVDARVVAEPQHECGRRRATATICQAHARAAATRPADSARPARPRRVVMRSAERQRVLQAALGPQVVQAARQVRAPCGPRRYSSYISP